MQFTPHNYQSYCIQRVVDDPAVGLFLRPGLGKTVITLSAINILKYFRWQVQKVLVVAPKKVAEATWSKEAAKWDHLKHIRTATVLGSSAKRIKALNTPADVYVINRENVEWLVDYYKQDWPFDMVVLDESTSFKNSQSKRFKAMKRVRRFIKKMVLLTGTPSSKGLIDLWAQVYLLDGGARLGETLGAYREHYFDPDQRSRTQIFSYKAKDGAENAVLTAISDICISMKAEDYLQLPDFIQHEIPVMLDAKAKKPMTNLSVTFCLRWMRMLSRPAPQVFWLESCCNSATVPCIAMRGMWCRCMIASWRRSWNCLNSLTESTASHSTATSMTVTASLSACKSTAKTSVCVFTRVWRMRRRGTPERLMCCLCIRQAAPMV